MAAQRCHHTLCTVFYPLRRMRLVVQMRQLQFARVTKKIHVIDMAIETSSKFPVTKIQTPRYLFFGAPRTTLVTWMNGVGMEA